MIRPHHVFDVQTTLAKVTRQRVDTLQLTGDEVMFQIGYKWRLILDEDQLRSLYNETDTDSRFREVFDELKATCLTFNPIQTSR